MKEPGKDHLRTAREQKDSSQPGVCNTWDEAKILFRELRALSITELRSKFCMLTKSYRKTIDNEILTSSIISSDFIFIVMGLHKSMWMSHQSTSYS